MHNPDTKKGVPESFPDRHASLLFILQKKLLSFLFLILLFTLGTSSLSENTVRRQKESLTQALNRDITYCYATTGRYPETLEAIKKDYGLIYDDSLFFVDYRTQGSNIYPEVTIIERGR